MQRRRLHHTKDRRVPRCSLLGRRCSHFAIPARSLACEIMRPGGRGHMRNCGTGDGRGLPENTGRAREGQLRSCHIHGSRAIRDPHALRGRDASHWPGQRFGTSAQCDQHACGSRRSGRRARTRRPRGKRVRRRETREEQAVAFFGPVTRGGSRNKTQDKVRYERNLPPKLRYCVASQVV